MIRSGPTTAKRVLESFLVRSGLPRAVRWIKRRQTAILAYHNVLPRGAAIRGDKGLHLRLEDFQSQLDLISRTHRVIPLREIDESDPTSQRPRAIITFDDAYRGAMTVAIPELVRRGLPATVFVAPGLLGAAVLWWDLLSEAAGGELPVPIREWALHELGGRPNEILRWAEKNGHQVQPLGEMFGIAEFEELKLIDGSPGITFACHTWSHRSLLDLEPSSYELEMSQPMHWLRERFDNVLPWLASPYGLISPEIDLVAKRFGYRGSLRISGGLVRGGGTPSPGPVPRVNIPSGITVAGFNLRVSGIRRGRVPAVHRSAT